MAIIYTSRNLPGSYGGDYTNSNWGPLMNNYAVRFTPGKGGQGGGAFEGVTFTFSVNVYFPNSGFYSIDAAADNTGTLNVGGQNCPVAGFGSSANTYRYYDRGTYNVSGSVYNFFNGPDYSKNPYGIAFTIDAPPPPPKPTVSISSSPTAIIRGQGSTISWSSSGVGLYSVSVTDVGSPGYSGSRTVYPDFTKDYTITVCGESGCSSASARVTVYIPPTFTLSLDRNPIIAGESTTLRWTTSGDASNITWTSGGITNGNLNSSSTVSPTNTTTYAATVSGLGGSDSDSITLRVYQRPTVSLIAPEFLDYGQQGLISYSSSYSNTSLVVTPSYLYDVDGVVTGLPIDLPRPNSAESGVGITSVSGNLTTVIPYNNRGPREVRYLIEAQGNGGTASQTVTIPIIIDETPDNVIVPESEDLYKSQNPVVTPDTTITSTLIEISDIDIPVEIKSNFPIQVDINQQDNWQNIRQL